MTMHTAGGAYQPGPNWQWPIPQPQPWENLILKNNTSWEGGFPAQCAEVGCAVHEFDVGRPRRGLCIRCGRVVNWYEVTSRERIETVLEQLAVGRVEAFEELVDLREKIEEEIQDALSRKALLEIAEAQVAKLVAP